MATNPAPDTSTMTIAHMDERIARHKSELFNLYSQRNSLTFVCRLPNETLQAIFICLAREHHGEYRTRSSIPTAPSWVNVSYVCRHWRSVALNCPTLWSYLSITSPRWTEELLVRSKQVSLKVHANMHHSIDGYSSWRFLDRMMDHVERIQEFRVRHPFAFSDHSISSKLSSRAPRLQNLTIWTSTIPPKWESWPSVLFGGDTPALRTLDLCFCPMAWHLLKLSGLTTLSLRDIPAQFRQNTVKFLATLGCMQNLSHLYVEDALASAIEFLSCAAFNTTQINLPRLSRLWLVAPLSTVIALLHCTSIPLKTEVKLECYFERSSFRDNYALLSSLLARRFDAPGGKAPQTRLLAIKLRKEMVTLVFNTSRSQPEFPEYLPLVKWDCNVPLQVAVRYTPSMSAKDRDDIVGDICCPIPLTNVQSLHVINPSTSSAFWSTMLERLPDLRHLKLSEGRMPDLASLLSQSDMENKIGYAARGSDREFVPALEELELHDISFLVPLDERNQPFVLVQALRDACSSRKVSRCQLTLSGCTVAKWFVTDMVGRWEDGRFRVVENHNRPAGMGRV